ncbi:MAG TPA: DinB family protein [Clostridia bacterium]|nr:DinB family protein [Clostridia bacterium]
MANGSVYGFLLDTYETEILKTIGIWSAFPEDAIKFRPAAKARTVLEQFDHQLQSEGRWMRDILGIDSGDWNAPQPTKLAFIEKYRKDARERLRLLRDMPDAWWREPATFFDVERSRAWVMLRRLNHSAHHRGQLIVYLRLLELRVPSVYGPTADTDGKVVYSFE